MSAKQLAYVTCDTCNIQCFARSDRSDEKLRALLLADAAPAAPAPAPAPTAAMPAPAVPESKPEKGEKLAWGALSWLNG